jgi:hypothetical protein
MASTKLTRSFSTAGNRKTYTISFWVKLCDTSTNATIINVGPYSGDQEYRFNFRTDRRFDFYDYGSGAYKFRYQTNRRFRDVNSWYHFVIAVDTTQSTNSDRVKVYVNGTLESNYYIATHPSQNLDTNWNVANNWTIGAAESGNNTNGILSHFHFCDGAALAPTVFGSTDSTTGEWKINTSPSFTLGTNGFTILKDGNTITDQSSNSNNWTLSGTLTKTEDCPSNVFATMNPFSTKQSYNTTFTNGNNRFRHSEAEVHNSCRSTLGFKSGKYYAEFKIVSSVSNSKIRIGISSLNTLVEPNTTVTDLNGSGYQDNGKIYREGYSNLTGLTTFTQNDIIGVACDFDNKMIYWYKNGTLLNSTGYAFADNPGIAKGDFYGFAVSGYQTSGDDVVVDANFGNGYFQTTAVATNSGNGYQDADGNGIMNYSVPTNYRCLCTKGLNQ